MNKDWKVFQRGHLYQIGRRYYSTPLLCLPRIEWYTERIPNGKRVTFRTSIKQETIDKAVELNAERNKMDRQKTYEEDYWKEIT